MTKATIQTIRNLISERDAKLKPLLLELNGVLSDDSKPAEHRARREREVQEQFARTEAEYGRRIEQATHEAMDEPQSRLHSGSPMKAEELADARLIVEEYREKPAKQQREQLKQDLAADLRAGDLPAARAKARAAKTLGLAVGDLEPELLKADPIKRDAQNALDAIRGLAELALMEPTRMRAVAGHANAAEQMRVKTFAADKELRWDTSLTDQVEPGYTGPELKDGVSLNAFGERPDPERDRQRAQMERIGRDSSTPDDTAARYARRSHHPGEAADGNLRLME